jgi:predicted Zn-dependent protease
VFNDNADQGVVRNNRFYHGELGIALQFPETWQVHNLPAALIAVSPGGEVTLQMKMDQKPQGSPVEYARRMVGSNANIRRLELDGLSAATFELPNVMGGVIYHGKLAYILRAQAKTRDQLGAQHDAIFDTVRSFHAITADERKLVKPLRLRTITARQGDTYAKLAQGSPLGKSAESYLRLINAQYPDGEPQAGQRIKIVE